MSNGSTTSPPGNTSANEPLEVKLVTPPKSIDPLARTQRFFAVLALGLAVVLLAGWSVIYLSPIVSAVLYPAEHATVWFALTQPQYLAIGDEGTIEIATTSVAQQTIGVTTTLAFAPYTVTAGLHVIPIDVSSNSNNVSRLDNLAPNERRTNTIKFQIGLMPQNLSNTGIFTPSLQMQIANEPVMYYSLRPISIWWIPYSRLLATVALTGVIGFTIALARDEFKKWLTGSEK